MFSYTNHHQKKIQIQHRPRSQNTKTTTPTTEAQKKKIWVQPSPPPPSTRPPTPLACQPSQLLWALKKEEKKTSTDYSSPATKAKTTQRNPTTQRTYQPIQTGKPFTVSSTLSLHQVSMAFSFWATNQHTNGVFLGHRRVSESELAVREDHVLGGYTLFFFFILKSSLLLYLFFFYF